MGIPCYKEAHEYEHQPQKATPEQAALQLKGKKKILILTGAGISAGSGIPTFRGQDGFWKKRKTYGGCENPEEILTNVFFAKQPEATWEWHYDFYELQKKCKPNAGHMAVLNFQEHCA